MKNHNKNLNTIEYFENKFNDNFVNIFISIIERYAIERNLATKSYSLGGFLNPNNYNDLFSMFNNFYNQENIITHYYCKSNESLEFLMYHNLVVDFIYKPREYIIVSFKFFRDLHSLDISDDDIQLLIYELWDYYPYTKGYHSHMEDKRKKILVEYFDTEINQWSDNPEQTIIRKYYISIESLLISTFLKDSSFFKEIHFMKKKCKYNDDDFILNLFKKFENYLNMNFKSFKDIYIKNNVLKLVKFIYKDRDVKISVIK